MRHEAEPALFAGEPAPRDGRGFVVDGERLTLGPATPTKINDRYILGFNPSWNKKRLFVVTFVRSPHLP